MGRVAVLFTLFLLTQGQEAPTVEEPAPMPIFNVLESHGFTTLVDLLKKSGLDATLSGEGPFTIFAPTNAAFVRLNPKIVDELSADPEKLKQFLSYHVLPTSLSTSAITDGMESVSLETSPVTFSVNENLYKINDAPINPTNLEASNGVIHVINKVQLLPQDKLTLEARTNTIADILTSKGLTTFLELAKKANLENDLITGGHYTVLVPTNEAFAALDPAHLEALTNDPAKLEKVLQYHVMLNKLHSVDITNGLLALTTETESVVFEKTEADTMINNAAKIIETDIDASNGIIHIIDHTLTPPSIQEVPTLGVYEMALLKGFGTLTDILKKAGLDTTLSGEEQYTLFAPTNFAFSLVNPEIMTELTNDPEKSKKVAEYHIVPGLIKSEMFTTGGEAASIETSPLTFSTGPLGAVVNGVEAFATDIVATNGIIHVVQEVLIPSQSHLPFAARTDTVNDVATTNGFSTFQDFVKQAGLENIMNNGGPYTVFAPNNEAFAAVEPAILESWSTNPRKLREVIDMHILRSKIPTADIVSGSKLTSLAARPLVFESSEAGLTVNGVKVSKPDMSATNGMVHGIDAVILPVVETPTLAEPAKSV